MPPAIEIAQCGRILRHGEDQLAGFFRLVVFAQPLHAREDVAGIVPCIRRHRVEQRLGIVQPLDHRGAGVRDRKLVAAEPGRGAHAGLDIFGIEALVHARLVIGARQHAAEHREHFVLSVGAAFLVAPGITHQRRGALAVAFGEQRAGQHETALGGARLMVGEKGEHRAFAEIVVRHGVFGAAAEQRRVRPVRISVHEGGVAGKAHVGVVAAQDDPFGEFVGDRIADAGFRGIGVGELAFAGGFDHALDGGHVVGRGGPDRFGDQRSGERPRHRIKSG